MDKRGDIDYGILEPALSVRDQAKDILQRIDKHLRTDKPSAEEKTSDLLTRLKVAAENKI